MMENQDWLAEYVQTGSDAAFRELVTRYVDLVYSTALRLVGGDLKLRGKAQLNSREIAELRAALAQGTKIPEFVAKSVNEFLDSAGDQERRAQTNGALGRINRMSAK